MNFSFKQVDGGRTRKFHSYIPLTVDEAVEVLRSKDSSFKVYLNNDLPSPYTNHIHYFISDDPIPRIFVGKYIGKSRKNFEKEERTITGVTTMSLACQGIIVPSKPMVTSAGNYYIIMEFYEESVIEIAKTLSEAERRYVFKTLVESIKCLLDHGFYYTDLKIDQMLFRRAATGSLQVVLGDLATSMKGDRSYQITFHPPHSATADHNVDEAIIVWGLIICMVQLWAKIGHKTTKYRYTDWLYSTMEKSSNINTQVMKVFSDALKSWETKPFSYHYNNFMKL